MSATLHLVDSDHEPTEDDSPPVSAFDYLGNPLCPGCWEGPVAYSARQNSGQGVCGCPTDRQLPPVDTRAEALLLIREALDLLDPVSAGHPLVCVCQPCAAYRVLQGGRA